MKILYLHGLDSSLPQDRREVLQGYGEIMAPQIDYRNAPNLLQDLVTEYATADVVVGSSAGGLAGYYFAGSVHVPALLFNPALPFRNEAKNLPETTSLQVPFLQVVLGWNDEVVPAKETLNLLRTDKIYHKLETHLIHHMAHAIPIDVFAHEFDFFVKKLL